MRKIERLNILCNVLNAFVAGHNGATDEKGEVDLLSIAERIRALSEKRGLAGHEVSTARSRRDVTFNNLHCAIMESRRAIEMMAAHNRQKVAVPAVSKEIRNAARIGMLALRYIEALDIAGPGEPFKTVSAALKAALDDFTTAWGNTEQQVVTTRTFRNEMVRELVILGGKLEGYTNLIAYNVSETDRKELFNSLRVMLPKQSRKHVSGATASESTADTSKPLAVPVQTTTPIQVAA